MADGSTKSRKPGCLPIAFLIGAALIAGAVHLMNRWDSLPGAGKAGSILLMMLGTVLVLPAVLYYGFRIGLKILLRRTFGEFGKTAEKMILANKSMYGDVHEFRDAVEKDFENLDRDWYERETAGLVARGWRHLGDIVDVTIEKLGMLFATPVIRVLASPDGTTSVGMYHVMLKNTPKRLEGSHLGTFDVSTEFSDGTFLITANTKETDLTTKPTGFEKQQFPKETALAELVDAHEQKKQALLAAKTDVQPVVINTMAEALESEKRQQKLKNQFRKDIGYVDSAEVKRIAKEDKVDDDVADMVTDAVEREKKRQPE